MAKFRQTCAFLLGALVLALSGPAHAVTSTSENVVLLAAAIYHEARNQPLIGQVAVGYVVINRVLEGKPGGSVKAVLQAPHQFPWWPRRNDITELNAWQNAITIATVLLEGRAGDPSFGATYFHAIGTTPAWAKHMKQTAVIGAHVFYRE